GSVVPAGLLAVRSGAVLALWSVSGAAACGRGWARLGLPLFPYTTLFRSHDARPRPGSAGGVRGRRRAGLAARQDPARPARRRPRDRKRTRLNSSHRTVSYAVFWVKKKNTIEKTTTIAGGTASRQMILQSR